MKKLAFTAFTPFLAMSMLLIQIKAPAQQKGKQHTIALGINIPVGAFSESHIAGIGSHYAWSNHRFGQLGQMPGKIIGITADGGVDYYFGKRETTAGYGFTFGSYFYLHAFGGVIYNPCTKGNITLTTGPTLGLYKGNAEVGVGVLLKGTYYISQRIGLTPGILYMKHALVNTLWSPSIRATYDF